MQSLIQNFRYALRQLSKSPGFTLTAILSLALGIGATTAVFSVIYAILLDPYPYANPDRMVHLKVVNTKGDEQQYGLTAGQWQQIRKAPSVEDAFITDQWNLTITGHDVPEDVAAGQVSSNIFQFLGVPASLGRNMQPSDAVDGQEPLPVVELSYKFWQRHYNSDPAAVGQTLQLVHKNYTVIGVAAPRFTWNDVDVYVPLKVTQNPQITYSPELRLKPGISHEAADAALLPIMQQFAKEAPKHFPKEAFKLHVVGLNEDFIHQLGGTLTLLFCAVALLLMIGCGNVSILLMARGTARQQEFAIRSAIGASRTRMILQLLTESLVLSLTGAALGVVLAYLSLEKIVAALPQNSFPHEAAIQINVPVLSFSVTVAILTGVLFGLWPALQISRPDVGRVMQSGSRKVAGSVQGRRVLGSLIAGQIALTLLILAGAGAALEGFLSLLNTKLGYDPHNIMSVGIPIHEDTYKTWAERAGYFEQLRARAATVPGVETAAISSNATPPSNGQSMKFEILGRPSSQDQEGRVNFVSPGYFSALRIPLAQGRVWDDAENGRGALLVVINQTMSKRFFAGVDPIGRSIKLPIDEIPPYTFMAKGADGWLQIVGVIEDKRDDGLRKPVLPEVFVPYTLKMYMWTQILVRTKVPPLTLLHDIKTKVSQVDADQQTAGISQDLEQWIRNEPEWAQGNLITWLFGSFAVLALLLAAVGLYSVVSYSVMQRTNEFGIRMALGAQRGHVLNIVFMSMVLSVGGGVAAGLVGALALNRVVAEWAEGSSRDPLMLVGATLLLAAVAALACAIPARRAARVDPMTALRYE